VGSDRVDIGGRTALRTFRMPRRTALSIITAGAAATTASGSDVAGTQRIEGYASATSVRPGESIDFHVSAHPAQKFHVVVYKLGWFDGAGSRRMHTGPWLTGRSHPVPAPDPASGVIDCAWPAAWTLEIPPHWTSGLYLAAFKSTSGKRTNTPFVIRNDERSGGLCVVLPFTTYQAYNRWPTDGRTGKSLYFGYTADGRSEFTERAVQVSFDRPYSGDGRPRLMDRDHAFVKWADRKGYEVTYVTSQDLHAGRVDPTRYRGLVFSGHDEYWSQAMRRVAERAVDTGASLAFLSANNIYWHSRLQPSADGRPDRIVACYKRRPDPGIQPPGRTGLWRSIAGGHLAEQRLIGVQYNGIVEGTAPLVVQSPEHWFWAGTGVSAGTIIPGLIGGEADGWFPHSPQPNAAISTRLSASPYRLKEGGEATQNSNLYETRQGGVVFNAGTFRWNLALNPSEHYDPRIECATTNLLNRMLGRPADLGSKRGGD
jgi:hypothetical protein